ncbi:MAG: S41 family peptidase [Ignavibacteriaceae bacterium]|nr:S41 family peptidase [Ignavibacteriaceae bacterium]
MNNKKYFIPVLFILLVIGILIGMKIQNVFSDDKISEQVRKFNEVLSITSRYYVDDVDTQKLTEDAIKGMLEHLDPHSVYINAEQLKRVNEDFQGSFEGVGIEFDVINDTLTVVAPISGGPSERLGIMSGDKIVKINGVSAIKITREDVQKKLRGAKGTKVKVTIIRPGSYQPIEFEITRDKIPLYSVDASFMYDDEIGYIKVSRFSANTYDEFMQAANRLKASGMKKLLLDLRGNPGGFLDQAFKMASEFIEKDKMIVYTESRIRQFNEEFVSTGGSMTDIPLIILVNGGSASASEIVSGAVQDWDRGLIVGQTTFGKGLVQRQFDISDGSALRVTTARYFTPAGRLIQKPYEGNKYANLPDDERLEPGDNIDHTKEMEDSTRKEFKTFGGRTVYGGGGITPDFIIVQDTLTMYSVQIRRLNLIYEAVEHYMVNYKKTIESTYGTYNRFMREYEVPDELFEGLTTLASSKDIAYDYEAIKRDENFLKTSIKSQIARDLWGEEGRFAVFMYSDDQFRKAVTLFDDAIELSKLNDRSN